MTRHYLASIAVVVLLATAPIAVNAQKKGRPPEVNQVYVKIIVPAEDAKDQPVVESWIAEKLPKGGKSRFIAATGWVPVTKSDEHTSVWSGDVDGKAWCCPVHGLIAERANGRIKVSVDGWAPVPGVGVTVSLRDEAGNREIVAVEGVRTEERRAYVAVLIGPPPAQTEK